MPTIQPPTGEANVPQHPAGSPNRPRMIGRIARTIMLVMITLVVAGMTGWAVLFLYFSNLPGAWLRLVLAMLFGLGTLAAFVFLRRRWRTLLAFLGSFAMLLIWFFSIPASNDRHWTPDVAVLATATINGNLVTIHNIRNFDYRSETDFTPRYYDKTLNLDKLESTDVICVYWGSAAIAHVMTSFDFGGDDFVCFSIETRKEQGEDYSTIAGFFRHYELISVVADERDIIRLRTNYRNPREQTYIYRTRLPRENQRKLFLSYLSSLNALAQQPQWYNTLDDNCTTGVLRQAQAFPHRARYNWKILLSGYSAEYAYEIGMFDTSMPFSELRQRCLVNAKAQAAGNAADFSRRIRDGVPQPAPLTMEQFMPE